MHSRPSGASEPEGDKANKTDPHDAAGLAQLARTGFYREVDVKSAAAHGVKSVIAARGQLVGARVRIDNTIRGLCAAFGIKVGPGQGKGFIARAKAAAERRANRRSQQTAQHSG